MLIHCSISKDILTRNYAKYHPDATEEIILTAKAIDFIEDVEKT